MNLKTFAVLVAAPLLLSIAACSGSNDEESQDTRFIDSWRAAVSSMETTDGDITTAAGTTINGFEVIEAEVTDNGVEFCGVSTDGIHVTFTTSEADGIAKAHLAPTYCPYEVVDAHVVGSWSEIQGGAWSKGANLMGDVEVLPGTVAIGHEAIRYAAAIEEAAEDGRVPSDIADVPHDPADGVVVTTYKVTGDDFRVCVSDKATAKRACFDSRTGVDGVKVTARLAKSEGASR